MHLSLIWYLFHDLIVFARKLAFLIIYMNHRSFMQTKSPLLMAITSQVGVHLDCLFCALLEIFPCLFPISLSGDSKYSLITGFFCSSFIVVLIRISLPPILGHNHGIFRSTSFFESPRYHRNNFSIYSSTASNCIVRKYAEHSTLTEHDPRCYSQNTGVTKNQKQFPRPSRSQFPPLHV